MLKLFFIFFLTKLYLFCKIVLTHFSNTILVLPAWLYSRVKRRHILRNFILACLFFGFFNVSPLSGLCGFFSIQWQAPISQYINFQHPCRLHSFPFLPIRLFLSHHFPHIPHITKCSFIHCLSTWDVSMQPRPAASIGQRSKRIILVLIARSWLSGLF